MTKTTAAAANPRDRHGPVEAARDEAAAKRAAVVKTLQTFRARRAELDREELAAVAEARSLSPKPMTWDEVAAALGTTRPYACRRFGDQLKVTVTPADEAAPKPSRRR